VVSAIPTTQEDSGRYPSRRGERVAAPDAFAPLFFEESADFSLISRTEAIPAKHQLFAQDTRTDSVYLIETGLVKLVRLTNEGSEAILGLRGKGWFVDAAAVVLNCPHAFSVVSIMPCVVRRVSRNAFMEVLASSPAMVQHINRLMCREICADQEQQIEFRNGTAQGRLERLIRELVRLTGTERPLQNLPLKKFEIAQLLAITPEHLSRLLREH
jgi:CRP-like cAMP-binding protein